MCIRDSVHTVQAGETLNMISQQYDVSIDDIMAANGLDNPNFIGVGQQLTIPVGGLPEPTIAPTEAPAALPSPIPTEPAVSYTHLSCGDEEEELATDFYGRDGY